VRTTHPRRQKRGSTAEFAPALLILFLFLVFPLINLLGLATGTATIALLAQEAANHAAQSNTYTDALVATQSSANQFMGTGFAAFAKLKPAGGYNNCGINLWVNQTAIQSQQGTQYGPNTAVPPPIDATSNIYEYSVHARYVTQPIINLSAVPFIGNVPGVGAPTTLFLCVNRAVEFPDGLIGNGPGGNPGGGGGGIGGNPIMQPSF